MDRRDFLKRTIGSAVALAAVEMPSLSDAQNVSASSAPANDDSTFSKLRGVNLGSWLVLEKWMTPAPYRGTDAEDEYSLGMALGDKAKDRLNHHRETFITADDFRWIKNCRLNAVRLPVGYWALEAPKPYVESASYIDFALAFRLSFDQLRMTLRTHTNWCPAIGGTKRLCN